MSNTAGSCVLTEIKVPKQGSSLKRSKPRRRSIIREFALTTSTHGLAGIARSESIHNCLFWTVSCIVFTTIMIFFITQSIKNYFEYPTQTSISIVVERSQTFPAVTFCNYSPARSDRVIGPFLNKTDLFNITNASGTYIFTAQEMLILHQFIQETLNAGESINDYFFSLDIMLISCSYNSQLCTADDFTSFLSSSYGLCFTFNGKTKKDNGSDVRLTTDNGGSGILELRLYTHSHLYIPYAEEDASAGIVAMIHDNTELPRIDVAAIMLASGRKHKLGYKKKTTYFLSSPYTDCTSQIPLAMQAMFRQYEDADYVYSQETCYTLCEQAYIYQQCGCVNPFQWSARSIVPPGTNTIIVAALCDLNDTCYVKATIKLTSTASIWDEFCSSCTPECSSVDFHITPSSVSAPSLAFSYVIKNFVESVSVPLPKDWTTNWLSEVRNNYVGLDVVCDSIQVENYTQDPSVSPTDVVSNVGGHTGLWIGISFLSIMEFVEMLYRLFRHEVLIIKQTIKEHIRRRRQVNILE